MRQTEAALGDRPSLAQDPGEVVPDHFVFDIGRTLQHDKDPRRVCSLPIWRKVTTLLSPVGQPPFVLGRTGMQSGEDDRSHLNEGARAIILERNYGPHFVIQMV